MLRLGRPLARFGLEDFLGRGRRLLRMGGPRRPAYSINTGARSTWAEKSQPASLYAGHIR
jgi:hypothetical protein